MTLAFWKSSSFERRKYSFTLYVWFLDLLKSHSIGWIWINNDFNYHSSFCLQGNVSGWQVLEDDVSSRYSCPLMPSITTGKFSTGDLIWKTVLLDFPFWVLKIHISHSISERGICFEDMLKRTKCIVKYSFFSVSIRLLTHAEKRCHIADHSCWLTHVLKYHFLTIKKLAPTITCYFFSSAHTMISLCLIKGLNQQRMSGFSLRGNSYRLLSKLSLLNQNIIRF